MVSKNQKTRSAIHYDLVLSHTDLIELMEDPQVQLDPQADEDLYLYIQKGSGSELNLSLKPLKPLKTTDKLVIRFFRTTNVENEESFNDIDIT